MTLKYKARDEQIDNLRKQAQDDQKRSSRNSYMFWPYLVIGVLGHLVHDAQLHMADLPRTKAWSFLGYRGSDIPKMSKWVGYISAAVSLVLGFAYKVKELIGRNAVASIDMGQSTIIPADVHQTGLSGSTPDREIGSELPSNTQNSKATSKIIQAASIKADGCVKTFKVNELL
jgi:hypothetical protein